MAASSILLGRRQMAALRAAESAGRLTRRYFSSSSATNSMPASVAASSNTRCNNNQSQPTSNNRSINLSTAFALTGAALLGGYCLGTSHSNQWNEINKNRELPKGERGCCSCEDAPSSSSSRELQLTESQTQLTCKLQRIVGKSHVHDGLKETSTNALFLKGERLGHGTALCIVQPGTIREAVKCLQEIVDAGCVVLPQGSNTGLTGG